MRKTTFSAAFALASLAVPATAAAGGGPPTEVFTDTAKGSAVQDFAGPCPGDSPGTVTLNFNDTFHVTGFEDGYRVIGNQTGTFDFEPTDPTAQSSSGHYRSGFKDIFRSDGGSFTSNFVVNGKFEDSSQLRFQVKQTFVFANGEVRVDRIDVSC